MFAFAYVLVVCGVLGVYVESVCVPSGTFECMSSSNFSAEEASGSVAPSLAVRRQLVPQQRYSVLNALSDTSINTWQ